MLPYAALHDGGMLFEFVGVSSVRFRYLFDFAPLLERVQLWFARSIVVSCQWEHDVTSLSDGLPVCLIEICGRC